MGIFSNTKQEAKNGALERAQKSGTDKRVYGDLIYRCRRCGQEGRYENIPNIDKAAYVLFNGNPARVFSTCNYYVDEDTGIIYKECMHHECGPGQYGYMELVGVDIKGQIYLADKYKTQGTTSRSYNPNNEIPLDDILKD